MLLNGYVISSLLFVFDSVSVYFTCNLIFFFFAEINFLKM